MAETKSFEEIKEEIKTKVEKGFVLDENKMADLQDALAKNGNDISKIDIKNFCKKEEEENESQQENKNATTINDNEDEQETTPQNDSQNDAIQPGENTLSAWEKDFMHDWREWAQQNNMAFEDSNLPTGRYDIAFRLYANDAKKKNGEYLAEISYKGPHNLTLHGYNGNTPPEIIFDRSVEVAMKNSPDIEFGDIKSPEFKAQLMAACYRKGANMLNAPQEDEISKWPKELQAMVHKAEENAKRKTGPEQTQENKNEEKTEENQPTAAELKIKQMREQIAKRKEALQEAQEAAMAAGGSLQEKDIREISQEGMSKEELRLRELRGQAKDGDKTAARELDKRRYNTMTDEFKYEREIEMEADGKTPKKDEHGLPVYKKDKDGKDIYKTNDKGQKIKTAGYQTFLTKAGNNLSK